jgi:hypothetical protein
MATCSICEDPIDTDGELAMASCKACADRLGLVPMPPASRPPVPCVRCNGRKFVRAIPREHSSVRSGDANSQLSVPMFLTHAPAVHRGWILTYAKEVEIENGFGLFEVFICHKCGFVEWYCPTVRDIPIHTNMMTELVDYDAGTAPYR